MKTLIKSLCDKLEYCGIDPITLVKAIGIFLVIVIIIVIMVIYPVLFTLLLITISCILLIGLIYLMIV